MNVERLLEIAEEIQSDLEETDAVQKLSQVTSHLQNAINQPNQPQHEQHFTEFLQQLTAALEDAPSNDFTPAWRAAASQIGAEGLLGNELQERIRQILTQNEITKQVALEELNTLQGALEGLSTGVKDLIDALRRLKFEPAVLEPGEGEISIVVPRAFVDNSLDQFGVELKKLNFVFGSLARLVEDEHRRFSIRAIASSELELTLSAIPAALYVFSKVVDKILSWIRESLEIRKTWNDLKEREIAVPEEVLNGLQEHANRLVIDRVAALREELIQEYAADRPPEIKNELGNAVEAAIKRLAYRFDHGFQVAVRVEPLEDVDEESAEESEETAARRATLSKIQTLAPKLQYLRPEGDPILELPDATDLEEESGSHSE